MSSLDLIEQAVGTEYLDNQDNLELTKELQVLVMDTNYLPQPDSNKIVTIR